jgi:hypothetical protein
MKYTKFFIIFLIILFTVFCFIYYNKVDLSENYTEEKMTAIIIEPREHKALEFVLNNFLTNLSNNWNIIIFYGNNNIEFINNIIANLPEIYKNRITLINLNVDNLSIEDYNKLLTSPELYNSIPTEIFLVFQTDTLICQNYKNNINDFTEYDYVGAPWKFDSMAVGNGGLSLRRKSKMLEIINNCPYKNNINEDLYFSKPCPEIAINIPSGDLAKHFSVESEYEHNTFGIHQAWTHLKDNLPKQINSCNGLDTLIELNKK